MPKVTLLVIISPPDVLLAVSRFWTNYNAMVSSIPLIAFAEYVITSVNKTIVTLPSIVLNKVRRQLVYHISRTSDIVISMSVGCTLYFLHKDLCLEVFLLLTLVSSPCVSSPDLWIPT